jgi:tRNA 5-methylaminomethyl-2-thiouridine biosynthesis bifunctional protein
MVDLDAQACGLPQAWAGQAAWTLLDADFQNGLRFLEVWHAWRQDPHRPRMLHYVGIAGCAPVARPPPSSPATPLPSHLQALAHILLAQCEGTGHGFRRMLFEGGQVSLTLCLGKCTAMLAEQTFHADTVFSAAPHDRWAAQMLARRCKRGTRLLVTNSQNQPPISVLGDAPRQCLSDAGFEWDLPNAGCATFNPHWTLRSSRSKPARTWAAPGRCAIIGAGISGACVARALATRGWQVTVFDQEGIPASGASGLPVGLAVPHVSADDSPRSRLSRSGSRLLMQHADQLLPRERDWAPSGVTERKAGAPELWHPYAAWIKPGALVRALLAHPHITFVGNTQVKGLLSGPAYWNLLEANGKDLGTFDVVVVANAMDCLRLLQGLEPQSLLAPDLQDKLAALQAVHGTMSHGTYCELIPDLPDTPVNGNGCFIPHVPGPNGGQWCAGSTFETDPLAAADLGAQHAANMQRLAQLLPTHGAELADTLDRGPVSLWSATRCVTHDRLPLIGPVDAVAQAGLWLCVGMGSRGLSFAPLCAELLAARVCGEPLPVESSLCRSLDAHRVRRARFAPAGNGPDEN